MLSNARGPSLRMRKALALLIALALLLTLRGAILPAEAKKPRAVHVQVLVVGGSPAGIAAAVAASRAGMTTLLVEPHEEIGGEITLAWLNVLDLNLGPAGQSLTRGLFGQMYRALGQTFDIEEAQMVLDRFVQAQPKLTVQTRTKVVAPIVRDGVLTGVVLATGDGRSRVVTADEFIDATDDASLAVAAGVSYTVGRQESGLDRRMQAATLVFRLAGVDRRAVTRYVAEEKMKPGRLCGVRGQYVWGYAEIVRHFRARNARVAAFDLNLGWQSDDTVLVNALQIFDVNGADRGSLQQARAQGETELPALARFLNARAPGFASAYVVGAAPHLYVRETLHVASAYRLTAEDILSGSDFWDRVAVASYPIDLHPYAPGQMNPFAVSNRVYAIPFRILVPLGVERLLVVGKPVGATYSAAGSLRVIPTTMAMGEAGGEAAAFAIRNGTTPARMAQDPGLITQLQRRLTSVGAYLPSPGELMAASPSRPSPTSP
jgi:hypothetical protein